MATVVVITHEYDAFLEGWPWRRRSRYLIFDLLAQLRQRGHRVRVQRGLDRPARGDAAILHIDATRVPDAYRAYAATFPVCINGRVIDISKRLISGAAADAGWSGTVIVKSQLNYGGVPERNYNEIARRRGLSEPYPGLRAPEPYPVFESLAAVPDDVRADPHRIVEKFIPETDADGFAMRFWVFVGEAERCTRYVSPHPVVKARDTIRREAVEVPESLRARRRELGFDFGKFDFVMHEGRAVLLDANKTPSRPANLVETYRREAPRLADALEVMLFSRK